jgi:hypothetical protein
VHVPHDELPLLWHTSRKGPFFCTRKLLNCKKWEATISSS